MNDTRPAALIGAALRSWVLAAAIAGALFGNGGIADGAPSSVSGWQPQATLPDAAVGLAATRLPDGSILAVGGEPALGTPTRMAAVLRHGSATWHMLPGAPFELDTPAILALTTHAVIVVAPAFANGTIAAPSKAALLDPITGTWTILPRVPVALLAPRLLRLNMGSVLAIGGVGDAIGARFDFETQQWTVLHGPMKNLASYSTVMMPGFGMILLGSVAIDSAQQPYGVRRAWVLTADARWRELARPPIEIDGAQAAVLDASRVMFGGGYGVGDDPRAPAPPCIIYNTRSNSWSVSGSVGQDHRGANLIPLGHGRAVLLGGHSADGAPSNGCELFDNTGWHKAEPLPSAWAGYAAVALDGNTVLIVGGDRSTRGVVGPVADTMQLSVGPIAG
jgi:hypothetical protein